jgi:hypothetical protein
LTKYPYAYADFRPTELYDWGRNPNIIDLKSADGLIDVTLMNSGGDALVPQAVTMALKYYQVTSRKKRVIFAEVTLSRFCTSSSAVGTITTLALQNPPIYRCSSTASEFNYTVDFRLEVS